MKKAIFYIGILGAFAGITLVESCTHDPILNEDINQELYEMAKSTDGFTWYQLSDMGLAKSAGTGHNTSPMLRTRYNDVASLYLDSNGMVIANTQYPDGSLIVKELLSSGGDIDRYAILYKDSDNLSADGNGWVWGYIDADGIVAISATDKGTACISCHSQADNIDYMLMNKAFPL